jgi:hypothetical protein
MDEAKLQEIEARANETVLRCVKGGDCDAPARWQKQTVRGIVRACYDHVGNRAGWRPIVAIELDVLDLADEFRRYDGEEDELLRQAATQAEHLQLDAEDRAKRAESERDEARADLARLRAEHAAALDAARREGAEGMREVVKAEIHAAFHYNDPPDDGRERPIAPRAGEWEAHQTLRKLLSRVCVVLTEGGAS